MKDEIGLQARQNSLIIIMMILVPFCDRSTFLVLGCPSGEGDEKNVYTDLQFFRTAAV